MLNQKEVTLEEEDKKNDHDTNNSSNNKKDRATLIGTAHILREVFANVLWELHW